MNRHAAVAYKFHIVENFIVECLRPALYLWPWMVAVIIYASFLGSDQGEVLSWEVSQKPLAYATIAAVILLTGAALFVSCLLALVASVPRNSGAQPRFRIAVGGIWVVMLCNSFGIIFAATTNSHTAWGASAGLAILTIVALFWVVGTNRTPNSPSIKLLGFLFHHRLIFSLVAAVVAIVPLILGAATVITNPMWLTRFSPLLISMIGLVFTATLFGAGLIIIPMCLQMRWIGILVFGGLFAWTVTRPLAVDEENPLLKADRGAAISKVPNTNTAFKRDGDEKGCLPPPDSLENALRGRFDKINSDSKNELVPDLGAT